MFWEILFTEYIAYISFEKNNKVIKSVVSIFEKNYLIVGLMMLLIVFFPIDFFNDGNYIYSYGLSTDLVMIVGLLCITIDITCFVKNAKIINKKKLINMSAKKNMII